MTEPLNRPEIDHPEYWSPRGIGGSAYDCFVCGRKHETYYDAEKDQYFAADIAGFVRSKEAGQRVVDMFGGLAYLDFRPSEPDWIQVKVGCCPDHEKNLELLYHGVTCSEGMIKPRIIKWAKDPVGAPGYEPWGYTMRQKLIEKSEELKELKDSLAKVKEALK